MSSDTKMTPGMLEGLIEDPRVLWSVEGSDATRSFDTALYLLGDECGVLHAWGRDPLPSEQDLVGWMLGKLGEWVEEDTPWQQISNFDGDGEFLSSPLLDDKGIRTSLEVLAQRALDLGKEAGGRYSRRLGSVKVDEGDPVWGGYLKLLEGRYMEARALHEAVQHEATARLMMGALRALSRVQPESKPDLEK